MNSAQPERTFSAVTAFFGGKYRRLILAILLFIVIDFGLLLFNYFASEQLARDSQRLTALGEMRMLTQQLTKSVLTLETEVRGELPTQTSMAQLNQGRAQMNASFDFLAESFKSDADFIYYGIDIEAMRQQLARARGIWEPIDRDIAPLLETGHTLTKDEVEFAVNRAVARNIRLSNQLDDLSAAVQSGTERKVRQMRILQITAITLALLNFAYIVFSFIRRLRESDRLAEQARRETDDILSSVREGLFLVYPDGRISSRVSASAPELLMQPLAGRSIHDIFASLASELQEQARDYLKLLFDPKVKPTLLRQIDPLREVAFRSPQGGKPRYLSFSFNRILREGQVQELLASISDVTQKVELERTLEQTKAMVSSSAEELLRMMANDSQLLQDFLTDAQKRLDSINEAFRQLDLAQVEAARKTFAQAAQITHGIKGEAHGFGLESVARAAHALEDRLQGLRTAATPKAEELVAATTELAALDKALAQVNELLGRVLNLRQQPTAALGESSGRELEPFLLGLANSVAQRQGKQVRLEFDWQIDRLTPENKRSLREILPLMIKNAIVHGIEPADERQSLGKSEQGRIRIAIKPSEQGRIQVSIEDDGRGIAVDRLRQQAEERGLSVDTAEPRKLVELLFTQGLSTHTQVDADAGRGDGLARVWALVQACGGKIGVRTRPGAYTAFDISLSGAN